MLAFMHPSDKGRRLLRHFHLFYRDTSAQYVIGIMRDLYADGVQYFRSSRLYHPDGLKHDYSNFTSAFTTRKS